MGYNIDNYLFILKDSRGLMQDEELLELYVADQEERKRLLYTKNPSELEKIKSSILANDFRRRELAAELVQELDSKVPHDHRNYFYAAVIFSRGQSRRDQEKSLNYAKKAYQIAQFQSDPLSEQIKNIYLFLSNRPKKSLANKANTKEEEKYLFSLRPDAPGRRQTQPDKEKEAATDKLKKIPRCSICGKQHGGPCPPKPK